MDVPGAQLSPKEFNLMVPRLHDDAAELAGDSDEVLMSRQKLSGLPWVAALEFVIVASLLAL